MELLLQTSDLVAIDKPAGTPTIPDRMGSDSVHGQLQRQLGERLWVVHRLDREVSGVLVFARTAPAHAALSQAFERRLVTKTYAAWTSGTPPDPPEQRWQDLLLRGKKRAYPHPAGKPAVTQARCDGAVPRGGLGPERQSATSGLLAWTLTPLTGRNHQLRVHLASRGWPIAGDALYGSEVGWRAGAIALRAVQLEVPAAVLGAPLRLSAAGLCWPPQ